MTKVELSLAAQLLVQAYRQGILEHQYNNEELRTLRFQVVAKQAEAPQNLTGVRAAIEAGLLPIAEEHSAHSIYGVRGNVVFRAWHDLGHYLYGLEMHADDEQKLAVRQWDDIERFIPAQYRERCKRVYLADTVGQTLLCAFSGEFPQEPARVRAVGAVSWRPAYCRRGTVHLAPRGQHTGYVRRPHPRRLLREGGRECSCLACSA